MEFLEFTVSGNGHGVREAVTATEELGKSAGLGRKESLRLRLLAEELLGMVQSITGNLEAKYRAEQDGNDYRLMLYGSVDLTKEMRKTLLSVSSTGKNEAARSFMGKLRDMITASLLPREDGASAFSMGLMSLGSPTGYATGENLNWSLSKYSDGVRNTTGESAKEAWDELEKSITASIADDVSISIKGTNVMVTVTKKF
ncbi:MAG: hypothetical protein IJM14_08760 [Lachnospiraceae bacterium]|nr:hypothetical protein [Lachnospiraceae bacterium]